MRLAREEGCNRQAVETLFKMHLVALDKFLKQKNGLSREEIDLVAEEVFSVYGGMLNFADIHLVFRNAKLGRYGELYNRLTCAMIMKWFDDYASERCETAYQKNLEADKLRYSGRTADSTKMLAAMGYEIGKDGKITINQEVVDKNNAKREAEWKSEQEKRQKQVDDDNAYLKWKLQMKEEGKQ